MVALAVRRDSRCSRCGGDLAETTSDDHDGSPGHGAYVPLYPVRCHRCTALAASDKRYSSNPDTPAPQALIHRVELRPPRRRS